MIRHKLGSFSFSLVLSLSQLLMFLNKWNYFKKNPFKLGGFKDYNMFKWSEAMLSPPLYVTQCLAHVEAFIDFSEDELIEDGVLNQGMSTLCSLFCRGITEQWSHERQSQRSVSEEGRVRPPFLFGIFSWAPCVHCAAGKKAKTSNYSQDYFL